MTEEGYIVELNVEVKRWFREPENRKMYVVRDGDLPFVPQPYSRLADRVYATPDKGYAGVWFSQNRAETYLRKHSLKGTIVKSRVADTGERTNDGRRYMLPV